MKSPTVPVRIAAVLFAILLLVNLATLIGQRYGVFSARLPASRILPSDPIFRSGLEEGRRTPGNFPGDERPTWDNRQSFERPILSGRSMPLSFYVLRIWQVLGLYWNLALLALGIGAAIGLWHGKTWGKVLTVMVLFLLLIPLFLFDVRRMVLGWAGIVLGVLQVLLALLIVVLIFWPVRQVSSDMSHPVAS